MDDPDPVLTATLPPAPVELELEPPEITTEPPSPESEGPTRTEMLPALPPVEYPVDKSKAPDEPLEAKPVPT